MFVRMFDEMCTAIHTSPTANGDVEVRCGKKPDHVALGDPQHEGKVGVFPVRWPATGSPDGPDTGAARQ